jgi:hypothetical protein
MHIYTQYRKNQTALYLWTMTQAGPAVIFQNPKPFQNDSEHQSMEGHPLEAGNGDILELEQVSPDQCVVDRDGEQNLERTSNARRSPIPDHQRGLNAMLHEKEDPDLEAQGTKREIHLVTPLTMIATLFIGFFMAIAHHVYYNSLVGKVVGGSYDQQETRL